MWIYPTVADGGEAQLWQRVWKWRASEHSTAADSDLNLITNFLEYFKIEPTQHHCVNFINLITHCQFHNLHKYKLLFV